jgi:hypothetical protein
MVCHKFFHICEEITSCTLKSENVIICCDVTQYNLNINLPTFRNVSPTLRVEAVCHIEDGNLYGPRYVNLQSHMKLRTNECSVLRTCKTLSLLCSYGLENIDLDPRTDMKICLFSATSDQALGRIQFCN